MLGIAAQRCFKLQSLNLSHNKQLLRDMISRSLPLLTKLTSLSLAHSHLTDQQVSGVYL